MKKLLSFITAFLIMGSLCVSADTVEPTYYVQGHFFKDMPKNLPEGYSLSFISYGEGKRLTLIVYREAVTLPEDIVNSAIPEEQLANPDLIWPAVTSSLQFVSIMDESIKNRETLTLGSAFPKFTAVDIDGVECGSKDIEGKVMVHRLRTMPKGDARIVEMARTVSGCGIPLVNMGNCRHCSSCS